MGDQMELTTWPKHQNVFYKVTSSALLFEVKAPGNAAIGLTRKSGTACDYWVGLADNNRCWVKMDNDEVKSVQIPNLLSEEEYRSFWLTWNGDNIRLGRCGQSKPIISHQNKVPDLSLITFTVIAERNPVHWKFEIPPIREQPILRSITGGEPHWVEAGGQLPDGALVGGYEKESLYIVRGFHRGSLTPGKFVPSVGVGYLSWGGDANEMSEFEVLCGYDCVWVPTREDKIPIGAVQGGYSENHEERLYVGRAVHNGHLIPGKVQPSHKTCYIAFEGKEFSKKRYEILVEPNSKQRCVNRIFISDMNMDSVVESEHEDDDNEFWQAEDDYSASSEENYAF